MMTTGKKNLSTVKCVSAGGILLLCALLAGCGCGQKKKDPASEQVLKISITPEPSPTPAPDTVDSAAVETNGDITMVNLYVAENPSAATGSTDTNSDGTDTTDTSGADTSDQEDTSGEE